MVDVKCEMIICFEKKKECGRKETYRWDNMLKQWEIPNCDYPEIMRANVQLNLLCLITASCDPLHRYQVGLNCFAPIKPGIIIGQ